MENVPRADEAQTERKDHPLDDEHSKSFEITIIYNGIEKPLTINKSDLIRDVLAKAIALFGNIPNPHTLSLFTADGGELADDLTVKDSKLKKHEKVLLRPSAVKAG